MAGGMVSIDHHRMLVDTKDARIADLQVEANKFHQMAHDSERDLSVTLNMVQYFVVRAIARGDYHEIREAVHAAMADTGISGGSMCEIVERLGICSVDMVSRDYNVTIRVPVEITVTVDACDEDAAEQVAKDQLEQEGLELYYMDVDYDCAEIENVEEA